MSAIDIGDTLLAKSDQLNATDLASGITVKISSVNKSQGDQPVHIHLEGFDGRPYKPCLSMRRVLGMCWGTDASQWIGRSMTIYCDNAVIWGGKQVGGIRISHLSDIDSKKDVPVQVSKHKREMQTIYPLKAAEQVNYKQLIADASSNEELDAVMKRMNRDLPKSEVMKFKDAVLAMRKSFEQPVAEQAESLSTGESE